MTTTWVETVCERCGRHIMAGPQPASGYIADCGRRLTRLDECSAASPCPPMTPTNDAPAPAPSGSGVREALNFVVLFIAFLGRDRGTDRLDKTLDDLMQMAVKLDGELRASLASDASPRGEAATGIELAARFVEKRRDDYVQEHGNYDPSTGVTEFPGTGEEYVGELEEIIEGIRSLSAHPAPATVEMREADIARWKRDSELLSAIQDECWDVRFTSTPNADAGDYNINIEIVGHFMAEPQERVVGENYNENLRAALEQAMTAGAYPPARPVYDEPAALAPATEGRKG